MNLPMQNPCVCHTSRFASARWMAGNMCRWPTGGDGNCATATTPNSGSERTVAVLGQISWKLRKACMRRTVR